MKTITLAIFGLLATTNYGPGVACKGDQKTIVNRLIKGFYYDNAVRMEVFSHEEALYTQEYHFTLYKMPKYHFGIDAEALPSNGAIKLYKVVKRERILVYDSKKQNNPKEIHHEPTPDSRKYIVLIEIPEKAKAGCITIALGYSATPEPNASSSTKSGNKKPRVKIVD